MKTVYLAGLIRQIPECFEWREEAEELLQDDFIVLNPLRGKSVDEDWETYYTTAVRFNKDIVLRDYNDIKQADIILMNLIPYNRETLRGTYVELGWAWEYKKPVIGIDGSLESVPYDHPFISEMVTYMRPTVESACEHLLRYYI